MPPTASENVTELPHPVDTRPTEARWDTECLSVSQKVGYLASAGTQQQVKTVWLKGTSAKYLIVSDGNGNTWQCQLTAET
jgi:hypothetical protein